MVALCNVVGGIHFLVFPNAIQLICYFWNAKTALFFHTIFNNCLISLIAIYRLYIHDRKKSLLKYLMIAMVKKELRCIQSRLWQNDIQKFPWIGIFVRNFFFTTSASTTISRHTTKQLRSSTPNSLSKEQNYIKFHFFSRCFAVINIG